MTPASPDTAKKWGHQRCTYLVPPSSATSARAFSSSSAFSTTPCRGHRGQRSHRAEERPTGREVVRVLLTYLGRYAVLREEGDEVRDLHGLDVVLAGKRELGEVICMETMPA